jgi:anti-anti-sigma factor
VVAAAGLRLLSIGGGMSLFKARQSSYSLPDGVLQVEQERPGATHEVWLSGRIDIESAPDMGKLLLHRLRLPACQTLTVNCGRVVYIDAAGIATLLEVLKAARFLGKQFVLKGLRERPLYLFEVTRLLHLFTGEGNTTGVGPLPTTTL